MTLKSTLGENATGKISLQLRSLLFQALSKDQIGYALRQYGRPPRQRIAPAAVAPSLAPPPTLDLAPPPALDLAPATAPAPDTFPVAYSVVPATRRPIFEICLANEKGRVLIPGGHTFFHFCFDRLPQLHIQIPTCLMSGTPVNAVFPFYLRS